MRSTTPTSSHNHHHHHHNQITSYPRLQPVAPPLLSPHPSHSSPSLWEHAPNVQHHHERSQYRQWRSQGLKQRPTTTLTTTTSTTTTNQQQSNKKKKAQFIVGLVSPASASPSTDGSVSGEDADVDKKTHRGNGLDDDDSGDDSQDQQDDDEEDLIPKLDKATTEEIVLWQLRQPPRTLDVQNLDALLLWGISDYSFVLNSKQTFLPSPESTTTDKDKDKDKVVAGPPVEDELPKVDRVSLGKGKFSEVLLVRKGEVEFALKHTPLHPHHPLIATRLLREPTILAQLLPHPNLVKVYETVRTPGHFYLVEENLRESVTLESFVARSEGGVLRDETAWSVLRQLSSVVRSLHEPLRVCHRDIKPENILVRPLPHSPSPPSPSPSPSSPSQPQPQAKTAAPEVLLKLLDFGLATHFSASEAKLTTCCGSPAYHSPELWRSLREPSGSVKYWGPEVDIWCVGLTLLRCLTPNKYPLGISHTSLFSLSDKVVDALLAVHCEPLKRVLAGFMQIDGEKRMRFFEKFCKETLGEGGLEGNPAAVGWDGGVGKREFKSTTFLKSERRHTLDLPLLEVGKSLPAGMGMGMGMGMGTMAGAGQQRSFLGGPTSRSPSRSRPRHRPTGSTATNATVTPPLSRSLSPTGTTDSSLPTTPLPLHSHLPTHHPHHPHSTSNSSLSRTRHHHHHPRRPVPPPPIELVLLNATDEPIRRSASYIKYALRCAGILYHAKGGESDSAFHVPAVGDHGGEGDEDSFALYLQCVVKMPIAEEEAAAAAAGGGKSKASSALMAALRPPISRAHTTGNPVRSSSTPPVGKQAAGGQKKKELVKVLEFYLAVRKGARISVPGRERDEGERERERERRRKESLTRSAAVGTSSAVGVNGGAGAGAGAAPKPKRKPHHQHRRSASNGGTTTVSTVVVTLSDARALSVVREALKSELANSDEDEADTRGRSARSPPSSAPLVSPPIPGQRRTSGSRDARTRRDRSRTGESHSGLGVMPEDGPTPSRTTPSTPAANDEREKRSGAAGFFDFAFSHIPGLGSRGNSDNSSHSPVPQGNNQQPRRTVAATAPTTPASGVEDERSRAMAAAFI